MPGHHSQVRAVSVERDQRLRTGPEAVVVHTGHAHVLLELGEAARAALLTCWNVAHLRAGYGGPMCRGARNYTARGELGKSVWERAPSKARAASIASCVPVSASTSPARSTSVAVGTSTFSSPR